MWSSLFGTVFHDINCGCQKKAALTEEEKLKKEYHAKCRELVFEILFYVAFLILLLISCYNNRDPRAFQYNKSVLKGIDPGKNFSKIITPDLLWDWTQTSLASFLDSDFYRKEWNISGDEKLVSNLASYKVGPTRFRQHRARDGPCPFDVDLRGLVVRCSPPWSSTDRDWDNYGEQWSTDLDNPTDVGVKDLCASPSTENGGGTLNETENTSNNTRCPWTYKAWSDIGGLPITGNLGLYPPGGYVIDLTGSKEEIKSKLLYMKTSRWLDNRTRVLLIEQTLYSSNVNLFAMVTAMFEFPQAEVILSNIYVHPFRLFVYLGKYQTALLACDYLVYAAITWFMFREVNKIYKERLGYFKVFWNILELLNLLTSATSIAMQVGRQFITDQVSKEAKKATGQFYNFQTLAMWDEVYGFLLAFVTFMSLVQILHLLRFNRKMSILGSTLMRSAADLCSFSLVYLITLLAFVSFSFTIFGKFLMSYRTVVDTFEALLLIGLGQMENEAMMEVSRVFTPAFIMLYALFIVFLLLNLLVTILMDAFAEVREDVDKQADDHQLIDYILSSVTASLWANYSPFRALWEFACKVGLVSHSEPASTRELPAVSDPVTSPVSPKIKKHRKPILKNKLSKKLYYCSQSKLWENLSLIHCKLDRITEEVDCLLRKEGLVLGIQHVNIVDQKLNNVNEVVDDNYDDNMNIPLNENPAKNTDVHIASVKNTGSNNDVHIASLKNTGSNSDVHIASVKNTGRNIDVPKVPGKNTEPNIDDKTRNANENTTDENENTDNMVNTFGHCNRKEKMRMYSLGDMDSIIDDNDMDDSYNFHAEDQEVPNLNEVFTRGIYPNLNSKCGVVPDMRGETGETVNPRGSALESQVKVVNEFAMDNENAFP